MAIKIYKKTDKTKLSANFKVSEFACKGKGCCSTVKIDEKLVDYLQKIRDHFGKAITITSGYRCATHNKNVGGVTSSRHTKGQAADFYIKGVKPAEVAKYAESIGVLGIGLYGPEDGNFVHIDTRTTKSFWYGHKQAYRSTFGGAVTDTYTHKEFVKDVQKAIGAAVDGIAGSETLRKTPTISDKFNRAHAVIKPVQKWLKALGYDEVGNADGVAGAKFETALTHFQKENGCTPTGLAEAEGKTWRVLLKLN